MKLKGVLSALALLTVIIVFFWIRRSPPQAFTQAAPPSGVYPSNSTDGAMEASKQVARSPRSRETDPKQNPYAGALKERGKSHRAWDPDFIQQFSHSQRGTPIRFELTEGRFAAGSIAITQFRDGQLYYVSGELTEPEQGKFFFLTPPAGSKAGTAAGVVEFWGSKTAYRVEPTGQQGQPELWQRRLDEVLCLTMPLADRQEGEVADEEPQQTPPLRPDLVPDYVPAYNSNIVSLQSYPGSKAVMLLDFFGGYTPTWGGVSYPAANVNNAQIKDLWKRVAEDYMPFNINVTTDIQVYQTAPVASRQRCVFTPETEVMPEGAAGVAYVGSWDWGSDTVCWSIYTNGKNGAEVGSHEVGHTLGLGHQGTSTLGYYSGHGGGLTGWSPIMGLGYYQNVVTWAKGEYQDANNDENELTIIANRNNNVAYRADDTSAGLASARHLEIYTNYTVFAEGVIERTGDVDAFRFETSGGQVSLTVNPVGPWANLAVSISLTDSNGLSVASSNPQTTLSASLSTTVPPGAYALRVAGAGRNSAATNGFSSYGSLGYYSVSGSVAGARLPDRFAVREHAPVGTVVGVISPILAGDSVSYGIVSGNSGSLFAINAEGVLTVANSVLLDYSRLASNTVFTVQLELLINITNLTNPDLTERNRRVVVAVADVNDPPVVVGLTNSLLERTLPGTLVGKVMATDTDTNQRLSYRLGAGNDGTFAIDGSGELLLSKTVNAADDSQYVFQVIVTDDDTPPLSGTGYVSLTIVTNLTPFDPGYIQGVIYENVGSGTQVGDLTGNLRWPREADALMRLTNFETPTDRGDNYGAAVRGYLLPPVSGSYRFWIASDDNGELWLSATTNSDTMTRIAHVSGANNFTGTNEWTKFTTQQSGFVDLMAGEAYYIEGRMKEGGGEDHLSVAWAGPATGGETNVISGRYLAPSVFNYRPKVSASSAAMAQGAFQGSPVSQVVISDLNSEDTHIFAITGGSAATVCGIQTNSGQIFVRDEAALRSLAPGNYTLLVSATDSGSPRLTGTGQIALTVTAAGVVSAGLRQEIWTNLSSGTAVSDLTNNAAFPGRPDLQVLITNLASVPNFGERFGSRVRGLLRPTRSGDYTFFIASDDSSILLLSPDSQSGKATRIASVSGSTQIGAWTRFTSQTSPTLSLVAGDQYYLEVIHKEGTGTDHFEVAWAGPGLTGTNIIPGSMLIPVDLNYPPTFTNQAFRISPSAANGSVVGRLFALDSALDTLTFKLVTNPGDAFVIEPLTGELLVQDNSSFLGVPGSTLRLVAAVQDSGCGNRYPRRSTEALITITVSEPADTFIWSGRAGSNDWSSPENWEAAVPAIGGGLVFGAPSAQTNRNDFLPLVSWMTFTNGGFDLDAARLTLLGGITNTGDNRVEGLIGIAKAQTWNNSTGTLSLSGTLSNYGAALTLVANGDVALSGILTGSGSVSKVGSSRLLLSGAHPFVGPITIASAGSGVALEVGQMELAMPGSDFFLNGRMSLGSNNATIGALNGTGTIFANDGTREIRVGGNDASGSYSGTLVNSSGSSGVSLGLVKVGTGVQALLGGSSFSGGTRLSAGQISVANGSALGSGAVDLGTPETGTNEVLLLQTVPINTANVINVTTNGTGGATLGTANLTAGTANAIFSGQINLARNLTLRAGSNNRTTVSGRIAGTGDILISSPYYPGRRIVLERIFGAATDFQGEVEIQSGAVLQIGATNSIADRVLPNTASVRFGPGAQLRLAAAGSGDSETVGSLQSLASGAGTVTLISGSSFTLGTAGEGGTATFSGGVHNTAGSLSLSKTGAGVQILAGSNSFAGTLSINAGILVAAHRYALGTTNGATVVSAGGSLALSNDISIAAEPITLSGSGAGELGALRNLSGSNAYNGNVTLTGPATIACDSGSLWVGGNWSTAGHPITLKSDVGLLVVAKGIGGTGDLQKTGLGTATLLDTNTYLGDTMISEGVLVLGNGAGVGSARVVIQSSGVIDVLSWDGGWTVASSQTLSGDGIVRGGVAVVGTLAPGASVGTLRVEGNCQLAGTTVMELDKTSLLQSNDLLVCTGSLTMGGTLVVTNVGAEPLALGDTFKLFSSGSVIPGPFAALVLPALSPDLNWDMSLLPTEGRISIIPAAVLPQPSLSLVSTVGAITLSWPDTFSDFVLQGQTNASAGLSTNWYPVEGVINNSITLPLDPALGSVLFRLGKP